MALGVEPSGELRRDLRRIVGKAAGGALADDLGRHAALEAEAQDRAPGARYSNSLPGRLPCSRGSFHCMSSSTSAVAGPQPPRTGYVGVNEDLVSDPASRQGAARALGQSRRNAREPRPHLRASRQAPETAGRIAAARIDPAGIDDLEAWRVDRPCALPLGVVIGLEPVEDDERRFAVRFGIAPAQGSDTVTMALADPTIRRSRQASLACRHAGLP